MSLRQVLIGLSIVATMAFASVRGLDVWTSRITPEKVAAGRILFEHDWTVDDPLCGDGDGLGPVFNATSCVACHFQSGVGGSSGNAHNVSSFEIQTDISLESNHPQRAPLIHDVTEGVIHSHAVDELFQETKSIVRKLVEIPVSKTIERGCSSFTITPPDPLVFQELYSPALWGVGLIDDMSTLSISLYGKARIASRISQELGGDFGGNRLGLFRTQNNVAGKFGWKGQFASLESFVASACAMEIGLTNPQNAQMIAKKFQADKDAKLDMNEQQLHQLVCFVKSLPRPEQILPTDKQELELVKRGEEVFVEIGCAQCHAQSLGGIDGIYSDFHLYNLEPLIASSGPGGFYGDGEAEEEFNFDSTGPHPDQWQTPPLWGVADSAPYFHDGGSPTLLTAIKRHQGQAAFSQEKFSDSGRTDQASLIAFLKSLRAPLLPNLNVESR